MKRDDFKQYAANLRSKNAQYKSTKRLLNEYKNECKVLANTKRILESQAEDLGEFMQNLEKSKGIEGYTGIENQIQGVSSKKEEYDNMKD